MGNWTYKKTGQILKTDEEKLKIANNEFREKQKEINKLKKLCKYFKEKSRSNKNLITQIPINKNTKNKILELRKQGLSYRMIAKQTGVSKSSVGNIIKNSENK